MTGEVTVTVHRERASYHLPAIDLAFEADAEEHYRIREGDPVGHDRRYRATWRLSRGDWRIRTETRTRVGCTRDKLRDHGHAGGVRGRNARGKPRLDAQHPALAFVIAVRTHWRKVIHHRRNRDYRALPQMPGMP